MQHNNEKSIGIKIHIAMIDIAKGRVIVYVDMQSTRVDSTFTARTKEDLKVALIIKHY